MSGHVSFEHIPRDQWYQPDWVDEDKAKAGREKMVADNIIYGGMSAACSPLHPFIDFDSQAVSREY